ncbi:hypothetical protein METP3_03373 [Methanosarcinales archaeon]|nr:hypothetical protein METP3_03373 [Methanosarcinales archaeon]
MTAFIVNIRKMMGWCPDANLVIHKNMRFVDFAHLPQVPPGKPNVEKFQSKNVIFSSNRRNTELQLTVELIYFSTFLLGGYR